MELAIGAGLSTCAASPSALSGLAYAPPITIDALAQPVIVFDSGAARGENTADIPLSGQANAPDGAEVQARLVRTQDRGEVHPWVPIGAVEGGHWSGTYPGAMRHEGRLKAQVRVSGKAGTAEVGDILIGHVVCLIGQSEDSRMFDPLFDDRRWQSVPQFDDDCLFVVTRDHRGPRGYAELGVVPVRSGSPFTAALAHIAKILSSNAPGETILIVDGTMAGTSRTALVDDTNYARAWTATLAEGVDLVRSWGSDVGVVMDSWTAADSAPGDNFATRFYPFYSGLRRDGSTFPAGGTMSDGGTDYRIDHFLWDLSGADRPEALFRSDVTKLAFHGPHRFEDFSMDSTGGYVPGLRDQKQDTRVSIRGMVTDPALGPIMRPKGPEIVLYQNGSPTTVTEWVGTRYADGFDPNPDTWRNWTDFAHPSTHSDDGLPARARHTAIAALHALGRVTDEVPRLNRAFWRSDYAEFWFEDSAGAMPRLSTTRLERGLMPPETTHPHRTQVAGFRIDGVPAQRVEIVGGRIRVYPNGGAFDGNTRIDYGLGGASGLVVMPDDAFDSLWMDLPLAVNGVSGVDGVAIEPIPDAAEIASTLARDGQFGSDGSVVFRDPNLIPDGVSAITWRWKIAPDASSDTMDLGGIEAVRLNVQKVPNGKLRLLMMDAGGTVTVPSTSTYLPAGTLVDLIVSVDLAAGRIRVWKDGVFVEDLAIAPNVQSFEANRAVHFLTGSGNGWIGAVDCLAVWFKGTADGEIDGLGAPRWQVRGTANAPYYAESGTGSGGTWLVNGAPTAR
ncbi:hypothetical protein [Palleronia abyssalis]|uniref:Uncharacterized protein n=1 Tax=Palleronia abyssalis TaxID=1501240 RepID=A0A2R8BTJ2_9RHOB|nr:hypothetical protein [Palleronia abyssalis]SPJ23482.1 hypothetical protein PAA8504_01293 [Palleronia abyssalis]